MRADRLVAVLLLLQRKGHVTAAEVATELEVSERTARRDLEALGIAGLPVYSTQGRHGGWRLVGDGRTDLSGLTAAEARALFLVAGPSSATPELKAALRKLVRALPEPLRADAEAASSAIIVDRTDWDRRTAERPAPPHLDAVQDAVIRGECLEIDYVARDGSASRRVVHPLGLASKRSWWYLVADTDHGLRTFRVDRVREVTTTGEPVRRPPGFDLAEAWRLVVDDVTRLRAPAVARAWVEADAVPLVRAVLGTRVRIGPPGVDGRIEVEIRGHSLAALAGELAGLGNRLEIEAPEELREELARIGHQLVARYAKRPDQAEARERHA